MSCLKCAQKWNDVFEGNGKVQILQVPELGNGIFRVAACDEHLAALKKIIEKGLKPKPKQRKPKTIKKEDASDG